MIPIYHFHDTRKFTDIYHSPFEFSVFQSEKTLAYLAISSLSLFLLTSSSTYYTSPTIFFLNVHL